MSTVRKYKLTKIARGDYLLPSNDRKTIWRLCTYEDGPSHGVEGMQRDQTFWGVWRWVGESSVYIDTADWGRWEMFEGGCRTRAEAIEVALQ